jgi:hypothetical protein
MSYLQCYSEHIENTSEFPPKVSMDIVTSQAARKARADRGEDPATGSRRATRALYSRRELGIRRLGDLALG